MTIERVAVLGGGLMGSGIAEAAAVAGFQVVVREVDDGALGALRGRLEQSLTRATAGHKLDAAAAQAAFERIELTTELHKLDGAELVIEAVPENAELKALVFADAAGVVGEQAILASNTSSIPIAQLAAVVPRPERVVGLHFFSPVPVMRLSDGRGADVRGGLCHRRRDR